MKNLTKDYFEELDFLPKLLKYFALSPENRVTVPGCFDNVKITFYQDDNGRYHNIKYNTDWFRDMVNGVLTYNKQEIIDGVIEEVSKKIINQKAIKDFKKGLE